MGHMVTSEPFPIWWWARWLRARGDARALLHREVGLEPRDMWRHWSPSLSGGMPSAMGHVVTPELSGTGCHTPFRDSENEASICVPRMFNSHVQQ
jgi:hypothetical protein